MTYCHFRAIILFTISTNTQHGHLGIKVFFLGMGAKSETIAQQLVLITFCAKKVNCGEREIFFSKIGYAVVIRTDIF